jgi:hypothetical protein
VAPAEAETAAWGRPLFFEPRDLEALELKLGGFTMPSILMGRGRRGPVRLRAALTAVAPSGRPIVGARVSVLPQD